MPDADIGLVGLAVMGENLALNIESRGTPIAVFNRTVAKTEALIKGRAKGKRLIGTKTVPEFVGALHRDSIIAYTVAVPSPWMLKPRSEAFW